MTNAVRPIVFLLLVLLFASCASTGSKATSSTTSASARDHAAGNADDGPAPFRVAQEDVPAEVRAIETQIDRRSAILAEEIVIEISKNYEWDVALTGDVVAPQRDAGGFLESEARGGARATFRNLDLRAQKRIVVRRSGLDVTPFIRVLARGDVLHVSADEGSGATTRRRADACAIRNASLTFEGLREEVATTPGK
jgi:hypothetical protein